MTAPKEASAGKGKEGQKEGNSESGPRTGRRIFQSITIQFHSCKRCMAS